MVIFIKIDFLPLNPVCAKSLCVCGENETITEHGWISHPFISHQQRVFVLFL